jgi:hypothetical protein
MLVCLFVNPKRPGLFGQLDTQPLLTHYVHYALLCSAYEDIYLRVKSYKTLCSSGILSPYQSVKNNMKAKI